MTASRVRLAIAAAGVALLIALLWRDRARIDHAAVQQTLERMDRDAGDAQAAARSAAASADRAKAAARRAWNATPGSS